MTAKPQSNDTTVQEVVRYQTRDGEVHETRLDANRHMWRLEMRERLLSFAKDNYVHGLDVEEVAQYLENHMEKIMEIYAMGVTGSPEVVFLGGRTNVKIDVADESPYTPQGPLHLQFSINTRGLRPGTAADQTPEDLHANHFMRLKNLDLVTSLINSHERMVMLQNRVQLASINGHETNRQAVESARAEVLRRLDSSPYI